MEARITNCSSLRGDQFLSHLRGHPFRELVLFGLDGRGASCLTANLSKSGVLITLRPRDEQYSFRVFLIAKAILKFFSEILNKVVAIY
jgi:hypothetical protein